MNPLPRCRCAAAIVLLVFLVFEPPALALADGGNVVEITFVSRAELAQLAQRLDVWEVRYATPPSTGEDVVGTVVARITASDATWLATQGFDVAPVSALSVGPTTIPAYPCYHTIDEMVAQLNAWASAYPALTDLYTIGNSHEGRPLYVLRLTNRATGLDKPVFFLMANIHGRELITSETALDFVKLMLEGYGVDPDATWLATQGFDVAPVSALSVGPTTIPAYPCYHTIDEMVAQLNAWASAYPALTDLYTIGNSHEGRPLHVLRLTNRVTGLDKPVFFLMANIHGRELITSETALDFVKLMLEGYGVDPDATWLLDHRRIEVMVSANPDGHVRNEAGWPWAYWRKNANPTYGTCGDSAFGIDLNRNSSYQWGGASQNPCDETYQGPSTASETETQAIEALIRTLFPDQRSSAVDAPAPDDTTGIFITLHSYSNLVLWPWGYTANLAPNADQLTRLGQKLATFNGYVPEQAIGLYPTTGTTDDFAYGELGVASYTFEMGGSSDGFYPPCSRYDVLVQPNLDALLYAAKVARTPYLTPAGPDALQVTAGANLAVTPPVITVTARVDDRENGGQAIAGGEAYFDALPWDGGVAHPLAATDGIFDSAVESAAGTFTVTAPSGGLDAGRYLVLVRGMDAGGAWGPFSAAFVKVWTSVYLPLVVRAP